MGQLILVSRAWLAPGAQTVEVEPHESEPTLEVVIMRARVRVRVRVSEGEGEGEGASRPWRWS